VAEQPVAAQLAPPVVPYLPRVVTKGAEPTGQVAATIAAASLALAAGATGAPEPAKSKRRHKLLFAVGALVVATALVAVIFRHSALVERFTGSGYDTNPLPTHAVAQPPFAGAVYTLSTQSVAMADGLPTNFWRTERDEVNYSTHTAKLTVDLAQASIIGGTIGTPQSVSPPYDMLLDMQSLYEPGDTPTDPWTRTPNEPDWWGAALLTGTEVRMYQDVVDPALRAAQPASVVKGAHNDVAVTTYTYNFSFGDFYESAPRLFDFVQFMDGNAPDDASVVVTISFDDKWMVRYLEVNVDYEAVLEYRAKDDIEGRYPYRYIVDVISVTDAPAAVEIPVNVVDLAADESTPATAPVVTP
jgi:hypothetical protein